MKSILSITAGALALALALPAAAMSLPQPRTANGITYLSGGIGHDEATSMKAEARNYPLSMVFSARKDNEYLANVKITIKDKTGKEVLNALSDGPIMLVKVPAGSYSIAAESGGKTLRRTVHVNSKGDRQVNFHWTS